jgi:hypothetical protein
MGQCVVNVLQWDVFKIHMKHEGFKGNRGGAYTHEAGDFFYKKQHLSLSLKGSAAPLPISLPKILQNPPQNTPFSLNLSKIQLKIHLLRANWNPGYVGIALESSLSVGVAWEG